MFFRKTRVQLLKLALDMENLAILLDHGATLEDSLTIAAQETPSPANGRFLEGLREACGRGLSFTRALEGARHPLLEHHLPLLRSAEAHDALAAGITWSARDLERSASWRARTAPLSRYFLVVLGLLTVVTAFLLLFVVPVFADLFAGLGTELPWLTRAVIQTSATLAAGWWLPLPLAGGVWLWRRQRPLAWEAFLDRLPGVGAPRRQLASIRLLAALATLVGAGIPVREALPPAARATGNPRFVDRADRALEGLPGESRLTPLLVACDLLSPVSRGVIQLGERRQELPTHLGKAAAIQENRLQNILVASVGTAHLLLYLCLGVVVGAVVIGMYLPIFQFGTVIG